MKTARNMFVQIMWVALIFENETEIMKVLADKYLYQLEKLLPPEAKLDRYDPDLGFPENASKYDALLIRTVTKINHKTLPEPGQLSFIGSATAGFDHVDLDYLNGIGVAFARSEGCNANAVAEYVITALYKWAEARNVELQSKKVGIVGCGNTGGGVAGYLKKLSVSAVLFDPPKAQRENDFESATQKELLDCDILTFHTPLTITGSYPTHHMCSEEWLNHGFSLIFNTSRGGVVDEKALLDFQKNRTVGDYILDVWENEPLFDDTVAKNAFLTTPHIAGYSKEAKWKASEIVVNKMCDHFRLKNPKVSFHLQPNEVVTLNEPRSFADFLWKYSNLKDYNTAFKNLIDLPNDEKSYRFAKLRSETDSRFEFAGIVKRLKEKQKISGELTVFEKEN